jgi:hypothetical protein
MTDENQFKRVEWTGDGYQPSDDDDEQGMPLQPPRGPGLSADDLELLTLAAKAIGARAEPVEGEQWVALHFDDGRVEHGWNPLRHSDDAFALLVTLNLSFQSYPSWDRAQAWHPMRPEWAPEEPYVDDRKAAARRAVTRAAAEIGKAMT